MITDVAGIEVGHWTDAEARTGCTVVLLPDGTTASAEVRGGAPASREIELLAPERTVAEVHAVLLTGGSAFGLAAADGVMGWLEGRGRGFETRVARVPIVPTLGLFDLAVGSATVRPTAASGRAACVAAAPGPFAHGPVGAGAGATTGKWLGPDHVAAGGLGGATVRHGELVVSALVVVNAFGSIDGDGRAADRVEAQLTDAVPGLFGTNTTIGLIATNARLDKVGCLVVAHGGHDGLARSIVPAHTRLDGDALIACATGQVAVAVDTVRLLAVAAVERAVRSVLSD